MTKRHGMPKLREQETKGSCIVSASPQSTCGVQVEPLLFCCPNLSIGLFMTCFKGILYFFLFLLLNPFEHMLLLIVFYGTS